MGERFGRFGHHPDPATDFCIEVECIEGEAYEVSVGMIDAASIAPRIERALSFTVGGDVGAVAAKATLRGCATEIAARIGCSV